jgi:hypothetical protein
LPHYTSPQHGYKYVGFPRLAHFAIDHGHRLAGMVDESLFASSVLLPQDDVEIARPVPV